MRKILRKINLIIVWNKEETKWGIQFILGNGGNGKFTLKIKLNYHFKFGLKLNILNQNVIIPCEKFGLKKKI